MNIVDTDAKTPMHMRLTGTARRIMTTMAKRQGISQTAVVEMAVRLMAEKENIPIQEAEEAAA